jgi:hypothetical protein
MENKLQCYGRILHIRNNKWPKQSLHWLPEGKDKEDVKLHGKGQWKE